MKVDAIETTGAGDSYIGAVSHSIIEGKSLIEVVSLQLSVVQLQFAEWEHSLQCQLWRTWNKPRLLLTFLTIKGYYIGITVTFLSLHIQAINSL